MLNTADGSLHPVNPCEFSGQIQIKHTFPPHGHLLLAVDTGWEAASPLDETTLEQAHSLAVQFVSAEPVEANTYPLTYCDLRTSHRRMR